MWRDRFESSGDDFDCNPECDCVECRRRYRQTTLEDAREMEGCELAGFTPQIREYARLYGRLREGYLDVDDQGMDYLQVAEIGDAVVNGAERRQLDDMKESSG